LIGVGFYVAATFLAVLSVAGILFAGRFEQLLPACPAGAELLWRKTVAVPTLTAFDQLDGTCGDRPATGSLSMMERTVRRECHLVVIAPSKAGSAALTVSTKTLQALDGVAGAQLPPARNECPRAVFIMRSALRTVASLREAALLCLLAVCLVGCHSGVKDADMDDLKAQIKAEFKKKHQTVTTYLLSKDSSFQVSGLIHVDVETAMGVRTYYSTCLATMDPDARKFDWHCDSVP